ncbi:MAG: lysozyme inhibitor LprI family protein [Methylococcaceae bacterium]|nr:lysozyme inhibitor LprI family protein [Methylococcaceae bacterium]
MNQNLHKVAQLIIAASLQLWTIIHEPVYAASFDCSQANTPREHFICSRPELSELDSQLGRVYQEKKSLLSPQGAQLLQQAERGWLRYVAQICPLNPSTQQHSSLWSPESCLARQYRERLNQLAKVGQTMGPYRFNRIDLYEAKPVSNLSDTTGHTEGFSTKHTAYPQIDNADSDEALAWNKRQVTGLSGMGNCDGDGNYDIDYIIGYANKHLISKATSWGQYCHGTPHGVFSSKTQNFVISPEQRTLKAEDVFAVDEGWKDKLQSLFWEALANQGWMAPENQKEKVESEIKNIVIRPERWLFTDQGLQVTFNAYEGGCYACTPEPVTVGWPKLNPLLRQDSVLP